MPRLSSAIRRPNCRRMKRPMAVMAPSSSAAISSAIKSTDRGRIGSTPTSRAFRISALSQWSKAQSTETASLSRNTTTILPRRRSAPKASPREDRPESPKVESSCSRISFKKVGWTRHEEAQMKILALAALGVATILGAWTFEPADASAVVCARGPYRAGCAGPRGAAVVRHPYHAPRYHYRVHRRRW